VLGFDACHFPNHYNILIRAPRPVTGLELSLAPETEIRFECASPRAPGAAADGLSALLG
jgi:hypothetical protein